MVGTLKQNTKDLCSPFEVNSSDYILEENSRAEARDWLGFKSCDKSNLSPFSSECFPKELHMNSKMLKLDCYHPVWVPEI